MTRIETMFGVVLVVLVLLIGGLVMMGGASGGGAAAVAAPAGGSFLNGDAQADICGCYERGYAMSRTGADLLSTSYEAGYGACREAAGAMGGSAWSWGWSNGIEGGSESCRAFTATTRR